MGYLLYKNVHILCVAASFALFFVRGLWALHAYPASTETWARWLPYAAGALLLASAAAMLGADPRLGWPPWLLLKIALFVLYAALALVIYCYGSSRLRIGLAWLLGIIVFLHATTVAVLKDPLGILSLM
jgi:uncharacterized membrane protein SirB2